MILGKEKDGQERVQEEKTQARFTGLIPVDERRMVRCG